MVSLKIGLSQKAKKWLSDKLRKTKGGNLALVFWLNVSGKWSKTCTATPEVALVPEKDTKTNNRLSLIGKVSKLSIYMDPKVQAFLPDKVIVDVRGLTKQLYIQQ